MKINKELLEKLANIDEPDYNSPELFKVEFNLVDFSLMSNKEVVPEEINPLRKILCDCGNFIDNTAGFFCGYPNCKKQNT